MAKKATTRKKAPAEAVAVKCLSLSFIWGVRLKLRAEGSKLKTEGSKLFAEGSKLKTEGCRLFAEGNKLRAEGSKLLAEGDKLFAEGSKLLAEGDKLFAEGNKLRAEGDKLLAECDKLWAEGIIEAYGNITMEWKNYSQEKSDNECHLGNGLVFKP